MIYILEDDANIRELEGYALRNSGYEVTEFEDGASFLRACEKSVPELAILDVMLPGEDGLTILRRMRESEHTRDVPVMMVTARTTELDRVKGLDGGADDYVVKPFGVMELISRVKALLRRTARTAPAEENLRCGEIEMNLSRRVVGVAGREVALTYKEFELLRCLLHNREHVLTREVLMDKVWGFDYEGESRTVDMHVKTLRQKLGEAGGMIKTVRNVGYKLEAGKD
jgi:two-component system alkaline phosphatase synthesis response regulator PhoP